MINEIIEELSGEFDNVRLVDTHAALEGQSDDGIIGKNLMLEHLHPNQTGYYWMGRTFAEHMLKDLSRSEMIKQQPTDLSSYFEEMHITELDDRIVYHRLRTLEQGFPFVLDSKTDPYQFSYEPADVLDSLAFGVVHKNTRWDAAKVELARHYQNQGEAQKALKEYYSLIRNQPWNDSPYVYAARVYLEQNDFTNAEPLLEKAYELDPNDAFITKMLGAINLNQGQTEAAIRYLEESRAVNPNDPQMLYNLSGAYGTNQEFEKALKTANQVLELNPNYPGIQQWKAQLTRIINSRIN